MTPKTWENVKFSDIASFKYGKMPTKNKILETGGYPIYSGYRYVGYYNEYNIDKNTLIIIARGVGGTGDVKLTKEKCYLTNLSIAVFPFNNNSVNTLYLYYYFLLHNLRYLDSGSAQSQITISDLEKLVIKLPPLETQKKIAVVLSSFELNNKINQNLEQQAQAIFKSWFVDFEPFGGKMPEEWKVGNLYEIANVTMGQSPDGKSYNENGYGEVFYQGRAEFGSRYPTRRLYTTEPKRMANAGDILMSVRAPVGDINVALEKCCIGRGLASISSRDNFNSFILYTLMNLKRSFDIYNAEGTVFGAINKDSLNSIEVIIPTKEEIYKFEEIASNLDKKIRQNTIEVQKLQKIRDTLLPKLMSGEIDVDKI